jgi:parallel beta helix pectate lyase-like protein
MRTLGFLTALIAALFFAAPVESATLYVNNSDPSCGGNAPCFATIQAAVNSALAGDGVEIQPGIYPEQILIANKNNSAAATENDRITIEPFEGPDSVVITGSSAGCSGGDAIRFRRSKFVTLRGLTITDTGGTAVELLGGSSQNSAIHIERNRIFGNGLSGCDGGITVGSGNPGTLIANNLIYGNVKNGIEISSDSAGGPHHIIGNTIYANQWNGVNIGDRPVVFLANNIITQNGTRKGSSGGRSGVRRSGSLSRTQNIHLLNNLICGNRLGQINGPVLDGSDTGNLTPTGNEGPGVGASPGCDVPANVFEYVTGPNDIANNGDAGFTLGNNSPAIDGGMDPRTLGLDPLFNTILEADFFDDEFRRPQDGNTLRPTAFDMGALETVDAAPKATSGSAATNQSTPVVITLRGRDIGSSSVAFSIVDGPSHGSLGAINQPSGGGITPPSCIHGDNLLRNLVIALCTATVTYTPAAEITGSDSFTFKVNGGSLDSNTATVSITVDAP